MTGTVDLAQSGVNPPAPLDTSGASRSGELLSTKLYIPRPRRNLVRRRRLTARLNAGMRRKLTLISAPAGFGKTTLLSEWIPTSERCVTWVSLDQGDNEPVRFWAHFIAALQMLHPDIGELALPLFLSPQPAATPSVMPTLVNEIDAFPDVFALVLDDYHLIETQVIHDGLAFLLDHLPPRMHLVINTRTDPPLPLARLRGCGQLAELREADLRFTTDEAAAFLNQVMDLGLSAADIAALEARTEGWIAGLQLAALSIKDHADRARFIAAFTGSHRFVIDYLAEEVLDRQPEFIREFLLSTCMLERLCASLGNVLTNATSSQTTLEYLERNNLFLVPLDDERRWYRYHHLFADVLRHRLQEERPERLAELHRRASEWLEGHGLIAEAVTHALAGHDFEGAARLIEAVAGDVLRRGSSLSLIRWLDAMPEETIRARPRLCLARGWTCLWGMEPSLESVDEWVQLALRAAPADQSLDSDLMGEVAAFQATIASIRWEMARSLELSQEALDCLPLDSPWRSVMALCLGTAHFYSGDVVAATHALDEALRLSQADGSHYVQLIAASFLADIQVLQGHLSRATQIYQQVLAWAEHGLPQRGAVMAYSGLANILCEQDQLDAALAHLQSGAEQLQQVGGAWIALALYRSLARVRQAQGKWTDALAALDQASQSGQSAQVNLVVTQTATLRARLQLARGNLRAAEVWAANTGLSLDDPQASHPGFREVEYLSLARVLDAQGRHAEVLSLLDRLLQSAEAEGRAGSAIEILILQGLIFQRQGNMAHALTLLERALILAEPEGYVRIFLDEGQPMRSLLADYRSTLEKRRRTGANDTSLRPLAYVNKLLAAFPQSNPAVTPQSESLPEALNEREMEVLHLIAAGLTNREIADQIVIAVSTVKWHINHLYAKLGVHTRTQALARARELGLL
jgi:LuxR family maltose regulon positive regulatory protein